MAKHEIYSPLDRRNPPLGGRCAGFLPLTVAGLERNHTALAHTHLSNLALTPCEYDVGTGPHTLQANAKKIFPITAGMV